MKLFILIRKNVLLKVNAASDTCGLKICLKEKRDKQLFPSIARYGCWANLCSGDAPSHLTLPQGLQTAPLAFVGLTFVILSMKLRQGEVLTWFYLPKEKGNETIQGLLTPVISAVQQDKQKTLQVGKADWTFSSAIHEFFKISKVQK